MEALPALKEAEEALSKYFIKIKISFKHFSILKIHLNQMN